MKNGAGVCQGGVATNGVHISIVVNISEMRIPWDYHRPFREYGTGTEIEYPIAAATV